MGSSFTACSDAALAAVEHAVKLEPKNALLWYNQACYLALAGKRDAALGSLATAVELAPALKSAAPKEQELKSLWDDARFRKIIE